MKIYAAFLALWIAEAAAFQCKAPRTVKVESLGMIGGTPETEVADKTEIFRTFPHSSSSQSYLAELQKGKDSPAQEVWQRGTPVLVQGGGLKTWSFDAPKLERVQVVMKTEGRPLDASLELWQGPNNTPIMMRVYLEDGSLRPFSAVLETPKQGPNTVAIRNTGNLEYPLSGVVVAGEVDAPSAATTEMASPLVVQGGALRTYPFDPLVDSVQVLLASDGRPMNARIELLQGPNQNKQVIEIYSEDGMARPFFTILETPGSGNVVRIVNTASVEFPLTAMVEPYTIGDADRGMNPMMG